MSEKDYINLCKELIEERYLPGAPEGHWRQRDLETLSRIIEDKSGIRISLSTLKRLWRSDFNQNPHPATLDAIASLLDYQDWLDFKRSHQHSTANNADPKSKANSWVIWVLLAVALVFVGFLVVGPEINQPSTTNSEQPMVHGPIKFSASKTVSTGVPNTVIFKYDVDNLEADSFFIQQSWNEKHRVQIDSDAGNYSSTYYTPGFHRAKLVAEDSVFKVSKVHIKTRGWLPLIKYTRDDLIPIYLRDPDIPKGGQLSVIPDHLQRAGVDTNRNFTLNFHNVREFDQLSSNNFQLNTRLKCDSIGNYACPQLSVTIVCEEGIFYVPVTSLGCVGNIGVKFGEIVRNGSNSDLSAFGAEIYQWQNLQISVNDKIAQVRLADENIFQGQFSEDYGLIMGLVFSFTGTGSVEFVEVSDQEGNLILADTFQ